MSRHPSPQTQQRTSPSAMKRLFAMVLAVLMVVAPSWHLCALGGHCPTEPTSGTHGSAHETPPAPKVVDGVRQALICFCPSEKEEGERPLKKVDLSAAPKLEAAPALQADSFCLAQLLQGMPGMLVATPPLQKPVQMLAATFRSRTSIAPRTLRYRSLARGPPAFFI